MSDSQAGEGEQRLRKAVRKVRRAVAGRTPEEIMGERAPINLEPTTAFEVRVIDRLDDLECDMAKLQAQYEWVVRLVLGAVVTAVLDLILT